MDEQQIRLNDLNQENGASTWLTTLPLKMMMMNYFVVWFTDERRSALFPAGALVRDPHHFEPPTRREQGLDLSSSLVE